jgi:hypothetical protein
VIGYRAYNESFVVCMDILGVEGIMGIEILSTITRKYH